MKNYSSLPTVGILGGGQLGRMSALAAIQMGVHIKTLSPSFSGPVSQLGESHIGDWNDPEIMAEFVRGCDAITLESEWAPVDVAEEVTGGRIPVWPSSETLKAIRHKGRQKAVLERSGITVSSYRWCTTPRQAMEAFLAFDKSVVVKRFEGSYDGYGNSTVSTEDELKNAWDKLSAPDGVLVEAFVPFVRELAVLVARNPSGSSVVYPVVDTEQKDHRCHAVSVPADISDNTASEAKAISIAAANAVSAVGILGVELFELADGSIILNELAPRPHNTGHYTIEACHTSQFENHIRSVLDWPLGNPSLRVDAAVMINILGNRSGIVSAVGLDEALAIEGASVHIYGKSEVRPKRKMGHVTVTAKNVETARSRAETAASFIQL